MAMAMRLNCWSCWLVYQHMILLGSQDIGGAVVVLSCAARIERVTVVWLFGISCAARIFVVLLFVKQPHSRRLASRL
jgi:hypothetical protein